MDIARKNVLFGIASSFLKEELEAYDENWTFDELEVECPLLHEVLKLLDDENILVKVSSPKGKR